MKKHRLITVSAAMLTMAAALTLSGCGGSTTGAGSESASAEGGSTITVWAWDVALKQLQEASEKYKETNPDCGICFRGDGYGSDLHEISHDAFHRKRPG